MEEASLFSGLSSAEAARLQALYGKNSLRSGSRYGMLVILWKAIKEPMFALLAGACLLYFLLGEQGEGLLMLLAMGFVAAISVFQEMRSSRALAALRQYTQPLATVIRDGQAKALPAEEIVPGDIITVGEGDRVPADALILRANDLSMNESLVTGETFPVDKGGLADNERIYQGTTVNTGMCYAKVTDTGNDTMLGRLGIAIEESAPSTSQLQTWIAGFVKAMAIFGISAFVLMWGINYYHSHDLTLSLLTGLTLAMSAIPEEIPVAFSSFMALGAYRLAALGIVVRHPQVIENLGVVSVICLDKTGTLTENRMQVRVLYAAAGAGKEEWQDGRPWGDSRVLWYARLACEAEPFDVMEKAIVEAFGTSAGSSRYTPLRLVKEYPLGGRPPMMTHVYAGEVSNIAAAKGAPERILRICKMPEDIRGNWLQQVSGLAGEGYRVLGICSAVHEGAYPSEQDGFDWQFEGLLALYDPPKKNLGKVFGEWREAGISVKILSGDYAGTVLNVARQAGLEGTLALLTGEEVMALSPEELAGQVQRIQLYARMFPEAKTKVVEALKAAGEIVAMSGDGVNDGPALRSAQVGIAMGKKGTEIAKEAADLVIADDDLERITEAIQHGRTIRDNLAKAIRYLVTIHIPIILTASLPLLLGWRYPTVFSPIHIIFLELIMGPTCSVFYESEPMEKDVIVSRKSLFQGRDLPVTLALGGITAAGILVVYYLFMHGGYSPEYTRTLVFLTLLFDNILLTFAGRSIHETFFTTIRYHNPLVPLFLGLSLLFIGIIYFAPGARHLFQLTSIAPLHAVAAVGVSLLSIGWFELYKYLVLARRRKG